MTPRTLATALALLLAGTAASTTVSAHERVPSGQQVGTSPWGPKDEIGRLNLITEASRAAILSRVSGGKAYDLATEYYVGMPSWQDAGDPHYQFWMTHTPRGTVMDDPMGVGETMNLTRSYTGTAFSMYSHTGTHIDALNHFGIHGKIWNGFEADKHLGDRGWNVTGIEKFPPLIARGVLIDVAAAKGVDMLPDSYRVTRQDLKDALARQKVKLQQGDVVLIRTGRMRLFEQPRAYMANPPGMGLDAARFLVEDSGAMIVGADNLSFETFPSEVSDDYVPLHTYLLAQQGAPIIELVALDELARDKVYEFAFIGGPLKIRGGDAAPLRLPPLRERTDFVALCERLLVEAAPHTHVAIAPELMKHLRRYAWPGNLRQLSHVLRCAIALLDDDERVIDWAHMPDDITQELQAKHTVYQDTPAQNWADLSHKAIDMALENTRGNVSAAARQLGISRQTLYRKLHDRAARP